MQARARLQRPLLTVTIAAALRRKIDEVAASNDASRSATVERLLLAAIEAEEAAA